MWKVIISTLHVVGLIGDLMRIREAGCATCMGDAINAYIILVENLN
jgi:hypothetical protein